MDTFVREKLSLEEEGSRVAVRAAETIHCLARNPSTVREAMRILTRNFESVLKSAQVSRGVEDLFLAKIKDKFNLFFTTNFPQVGAPGVLEMDLKEWYAFDSGDYMNVYAFQGEMYARTDPALQEPMGYSSRQPLDMTRHKLIFFLIGRCTVLQFPSPAAEHLKSDNVLVMLQQMIQEGNTNNTSGQPMTLPQLLTAVTERVQSEGRNYSSEELTSAVQMQYSELCVG